MSGLPVRMQGGVFLFLCALFAVGAALFAVCEHYDGFWELFFALVFTSGTWWILYRFWCARVAGRGGDVRAERGPLVSLATASAAVFLQLYYLGTHVCRSGERVSYPLSLVTAFLVSSAVSWIVISVARGLNGFACDLSAATLRAKYRRLSDSAQVACLIALLPPSLSLIFTLGSLILGGLDFSVLASVGNLVISTALFLVLLSWSRKWLLEVFLWAFLPADEACFCSRDANALRKDDFSVGEFSSAVAAGGTVALVFLAAPNWLSEHYLVVMGGGILFACSMEMLLMRLQSEPILTLLKGQWRERMKGEILAMTGRVAVRKRARLKEVLLGELDFDSPEEEDETTSDSLTGMTEELRRSLNGVFCENGRMMYVVPAVQIDRDELLTRKASELFDGVFADYGSECPYEDHVSDGALMRLHERLRRESGPAGPTLTDGELAAARVRLRTALAGADIPRTCKMTTELAVAGCRFPVTLYVDERGLARIEGTDANGKRACVPCRAEDVVEVLNREDFCYNMR